MPENKHKIPATKARRPFFLSFMCIVGFTYTGLFALLFLLGILFTAGFSGILDQYLQIYDFTRWNFFFFSMGGFVLFFVAFLGVLLMWKLQKLGFFLYTAFVFLFMVVETFLTGFFFPDIIIHSLLVLLFMIAFPFKKEKRYISLSEDHSDKAA